MFSLLAFANLFRNIFVSISSDSMKTNLSNRNSPPPGMNKNSMSWMPDTDGIANVPLPIASSKVSASMV